MYFYLIGIDYKSATINVREDFYRSRKTISDFWVSSNPGRSAILVTCNRIEIYGVAQYADDAFGHISDFSRRFPDFSKYAYVKFGEAHVFRHVLRLSLGLESQLKGEKQILAQLDTWRSNSNLPFPLKVLWDKVILLSKNIRVASKLNEDNTNITTLILDDIKKRLKQKEKYEIIILGTGKIAELFAEYRPPKAHLVFVAHKNYPKAQALAKYSDSRVLFLNDLPDFIAKADILISATSSPHYILKKSHFDKSSIRREYPLYIYDLAIPRDVEPAVGDIENICLHNLDTLEYLFYEYNKSLRDRIESASDLIEDALGIYQEVSHDKNY